MAEGGELSDSQRRYLESQCEKRREHLDFDVEAWYPWVKAVTFGTKFVPLDLPEARALLVHYQHCFNRRRKPTEKELALLGGLEDAIDAAISEARRDFPGSAEFFVRLSSRSPKDAVAVTPASYERALRQLEADEAYSGEGAGHETNRKMVALSDCQASLAVDSGLGAMRLLTASERVFFDLMTATASEELYVAHPMKVILRVWDGRVDHRMEFRCFVSEGELTAISQYNHYCYFPEVVRQRDEILHLLTNFWREEVRNRVQLRSYVADFAVIGLTEGLARVVLIELNPFASTTGGALYHWKSDEKLLTKGPLTFRVHEAPLMQIADLVEYNLSALYSPSEDVLELAWRPERTCSSRHERRCALM